MNRIRKYLQQPEEQPGYGDLWVVAGEFGRIGVTSDVARHIRIALDRWIPPRWLEFRDRSGSRIRIRTSHVRSLVESTTAQRARDREFQRLRDAEEEADEKKEWE